MSWTQKPLLPIVPDEAQDIVDSVDAVVGTVSPILSTLSTLLDAVKLLFTSVDPFAALMTAVITETEDLINDLFGGGGFELIVNPLTTFKRRAQEDRFGILLMTPEEAINLAVRSLDDVGDEKRPQFSDSAEVAAFGILVTAPDVFIFLDILKALLSLWTIDDIAFLIRDVERRTNPTQQPRPPDWDAIRFNQIGPLGEIQDQLLKVLALAKGYTVVADEAITDLINQLQRKVDILNLTVSGFQTVINTLLATSVLSGVYIFDLPRGPGGNKRIQQELLDPQFKQLRLNRYTMMALYVGGGPGVGSVDAIRQLLA